MQSIAQRGGRIPAVILTHSSTASHAKLRSFSVLANYLILDNILDNK